MKAAATLVALVALGGCASERCAQPTAYTTAATYNAAAEQNLLWSPFGRPETGWAVYAPAIAHEVGSACPTQSPAFARAVARWQAKASVIPHGGVDPATFEAMKTGWQQRRPFVRLRAGEICPDPPDEASLVTLPGADSYRGAAVRLRPAAAAALERMVAAARAADPAIAADPEMLTAFSGYRSPAYDAARCAREGRIATAASSGPSLAPPTARAWRSTSRWAPRRGLRWTPRSTPTGSIRAAPPPTAG